MTRQQQQQGFALFIVAALFMAFALIAAAMIDRTTATQQIDMQLRTREQMARIYDALIQYSVDHGDRYPCPADPAVAYTDPSFGAAVTNCESSVSGDMVHLTPVISSVSIRGMVPVRELLPYGIKSSDAFDMWNNRIMYVVDRQMTPNGTGTAGAAANRPSVIDGITTETHKSPDFLLFSYGKDGLGATPKTQTSISIACGAMSAPRKENCNDDLIFTMRPMYTGPAATPALYFDDIILVFSRGTSV